MSTTGTVSCDPTEIKGVVVTALRDYSLKMSHQAASRPYAGESYKGYRAALRAQARLAANMAEAVSSSGSTTVARFYLERMSS